MPTKPSTLVATVASLVLVLVTVSQGLASPANLTHEYSLDNGLTLIVREDHRAPVVVSQLWYKVGSSYEYDGITGISHALEHMMFKGTEKFPEGAFDRIISDNGGRNNAFTSQDYTAYYQELEKSRLEISFELEADRMRNLLLPPEEFAKEIRVVMEERRLRTEDNPRALTYERFNATAFTSSPARIPVIGWMDDLENMTVSDLREWYDRWYAPNNAILVVAGDVDPQAVYQLAKKHFGDIATRDITPPKPRREIEQKGKREIVVKTPAELPYVILGYKAPSLLTAADEKDAYALAVLASILDGGNSSRLAKKLVRGSEIAANAGADYDLHGRGETLLSLAGTPAPGVSIDTLRQALQKEIELLQTHPVDKKELDRIKAQVVAEEIYQRDSLFFQAAQIGALAAVGLDWRLTDQFVAKIKAISAEDIQRVAKTYLSDERLTIAELEPLPLDPNSSRKPAAQLRH